MGEYEKGSKHEITSPVQTNDDATTTSWEEEQEDDAAARRWDEQKGRHLFMKDRGQIKN